MNFPKIKYESIIKSSVQKGFIRAQAFFNKYFQRSTTSVANLANTDTFAPSTSKKLDVRTGKLSKSFVPNDKNNIFKMKYQNGRLNLEYGSSLPYANIHEKGGFIKTKGKMEGYFWYKFASTNNPYWKYLALAVRKNGGVNIPARPYFEQGLEDFFRSNAGIGAVLDDIVNEIVLEWNNA